MCSGLKTLQTCNGHMHDERRTWHGTEAPRSVEQMPAVKVNSRYQVPVIHSVVVVVVPLGTRRQI